MDRDSFLEADEAKEFSLIDAVFDKRPDAADMEQLGAGSGEGQPS
jgi:ATP-dependent Clp protease protease subunit